jgi:hypothetical protein
MIACARYALCRRVADGWLVLDTGSRDDMRADCRAAEYRDLRGEYEVKLTARPIGSIIPTPWESTRWA